MTDVAKRPRPPAALRPVDAADRERVVPMLARAFTDDPCFAWVFRDEARRAADLAVLFEGAYTDLARHACSWRTADFAAASLWGPPGKSWDEELMAPWIALMGERYRPDDLERLLIFFALMGERHPVDPHYYLGVLGTEPDRRGQGLGSACLRQGLLAADRDGAPAYLESSNVRNVPLYERFGFEVTSTVELAPGGPTIYFMWREPRPPTSRAPVSDG